MMTNAITPLVYGLLIGKSAEDYNLFFENVSKQDNFQPESIMTDFETGTIKSVKDMLPNILHRGCLFHFSQAVCRQVQSKGLTTKYNEDEVFRLNVKELIALAFAPLDQIITSFDLICDQFDDDANDLVEYFEKTCIGEPKRSGKLWNIHDRVAATVPRPNNSVEGRHNAFADRVAISHSTIVKLGEKIRREQSKFEVDMTKILQSHDIKTKKACYRKLDERITRLANSFDPTQLDQFLKNMAANITLWSFGRTKNKFYLDDPDGFSYYWYDLRKEEEIISTRTQGGSSVMIWASFGWGGKSSTCFINGRMNSNGYREVLKIPLVDIDNAIGGSDWIFQQDNALVHRAKVNLAWFKSQKINVLPWPSLSPDLNHIKNLWGILSRKVCAEGKQFKTKEQFKAAILQS
ncbi:unnamed protein product [Rotaria magnacalcarata]|uniref:Transposase n=4 Tax=Rotaria magnacalcarata TaxID=392030 RepID=A0A816AGL6_9BILA|nr:unnamed protein product [Rotaria magnacalcarata]